MADKCKSHFMTTKAIKNKKWHWTVFTNLVMFSIYDVGLNPVCLHPIYAAFDQNHEISFSGNLICVSSAGYSICIYFDLLFGHVYGEICQAVSLFRLKKDL